MTDATVMDIVQRALTLSFLIAAPMLGLGLIVGIGVAVFQAATQIHEMTLTFIPKMLAVAGVLIFCGPWMLTKLMNFTTQLFESIPTLVK